MLRPLRAVTAAIALTLLVPSACLAPRASGVYWLRLAQGGRVVSARVVSVR